MEIDNEIIKFKAQALKLKKLFEQIQDEENLLIIKRHLSDIELIEFNNKNRGEK